jgi:hypothetical protein
MAASVGGAPPPEYYAASAPVLSPNAAAAAAAAAAQGALLSQSAQFAMPGPHPSQLQSQTSFTSSTGFAPGVGTFAPGTAGSMATSVLELSISCK